MKNENVSWLVGVPITDGNFKYRLQRASIEEIELALKQVTQPSKVKTLMNRLNKLKKEYGERNQNG